MALPKVEKMVQLEIDATIDGEKYTNVCFFHSASEVDLGDLDALAELWAELYRDNALPLHTNNFVLQGAKATELASGSRAEGHFALPVALAGGDGNAYMPNNVAFCLKKLTNTLPLVKRGRVFIGAISRNALSGINRLSNAAADSWVDAWQSIVVGMNTQPGVDGTMVVLRGYKNNANPGDVTFSDWYDVAYTDTILDSQRRRLPHRGI